MPRNYFFTCLFVIFCHFVTDIAAHHAIIGGKVAQPGQFPYFVSVRVNGEDDCGGGIVGSRHVLTAAHCVINDKGQLESKNVSVLAGTNDLQRTNKPGVIIKVVKLHVSPDYKPQKNRTRGDIAVLKLERPFELSQHIQILKLPRYVQNYTGQTAEIAGFGWNSITVRHKQQSGRNSDTQLRFAEANVVSQKECAEVNNRKDTPNNLFCARVKQGDAANPRGVCFGDSGGPLVYDDTVIGIYTHGPFGCTEKFRPGIYSRVLYYLPFIRRYLKSYTL